MDNIDNQIPASDLLALIAQLRAPVDVWRESDSLRHYMRGVAQGRAQAAERLADLLREYGIEVPDREAGEGER